MPKTYKRAIMTLLIREANITVPYNSYSNTQEDMHGSRGSRQLTMEMQPILNLGEPVHRRSYLKPSQKPRKERKQYIRKKQVEAIK